MLVLVRMIVFGGRLRLGGEGVLRKFWIVLRVVGRVVVVVGMIVGVDRILV